MTSAEVRNTNQSTDRGGYVLSVCLSVGSAVHVSSASGSCPHCLRAHLFGFRDDGGFDWPHEPAERRRPTGPAGASEDAGRYRGCKCQHFLCGWRFFSCASSAKREKFGSHETMLIRRTVATRRSLCQNRQKRAGYWVSDGNRETLTRRRSRSRFWESSRENLIGEQWLILK